MQTRLSDQIAGAALLSAVLITTGLDKDWWLSWIVWVPWLTLVTIGYVIWKRRASAHANL